ncbi:MAG: PHP domain-containing protein [Candidatus Tectomicrobia bacterium]|uniref:PHP domain-containing protein n=1 Tax=Tectimicrobiota bacterium TaxID=2528274 RepID=A0A933GMU2_UNCTE|nr:PHP domain-containing protein [Candidatus Tectomicrobia bacterium]
MLIDLHIHTIYGSSCSVLNPNDLIHQAKLSGLQGGCLTEHNEAWRPDKLKELVNGHGEDFVLINGMEVHTDLGHILVFGLPSYVEGINKAERLRKIADQEGGVLIAAHPFRSELSAYYNFNLHSREVELPISIEEACQHPIFQLVDAMEVVNGGSTWEEMDFCLEISRRINKAGTGGSDAHSIHGLGCCATSFSQVIKTPEDMISAIKSGQFQATDRRLNVPRFRSLPLYYDEVI